MHELNSRYFPVGGPIRIAQKAAAGVDVRIIMPIKWQLLSWLVLETEKDLRDRKNNDLNNLLNWFGPQGVAPFFSCESSMRNTCDAA